MGTFYLDGRLGAGGQGVVDEGYGVDGRRVAVKALHRVEDGDRDRLRKEVQAWRRVAPFCTTEVLLALRYQWEADVLKLPGFVATNSDLDATGQTLMAAADTRVEFWNVDTRTRTGSYTAPARIHRVDLSDDGKTAAVSTDDGYTRVLDVAGARPRDAHAFPTPEQTTGYWPPMKLSPLGTYLTVETPRLRTRTSTTKRAY
ncbi:hypothetical protein [Streptomyces sp. NBC_00272]|uniref:hypothetical protein n=1 Tax=Streptomyces sp. NBC_00272 TaxID=2975698 RepID=UPI002E2DC6C1|nr:hypothetical protein [Streptomyces sp. NBC_00272]